MTQTSSARPGLLREFTGIFSKVSAPYHEPRAVVHRRRVVVAVVVLLGAAVLASMHTKNPGDAAFYWLSLALAAVWSVGAVVAGPLHLGAVRFRGRNERPVFTGTGVGLLLGGVFLLGGLAVQQIPPLAGQVTAILDYTTQVSWRLVVLIAIVNAVAEEMFFRGALFSAFGRRYPLVLSTLLYIAAMMAAGNLMIGVAALVLGTVCAIERRATGGVLAPVLTHLVWGLMMVLALPPIFGR
ncbi:CPBP family intramembrane metalloprotease [Mycolicibacter terrae]|uniref:Abortive infection protein n=2 Tax=Mycolicibacter TaxID=1073531 RepID=A0A1A2Y1Q9_MYCSD|nr:MULTISPECIES: CPBP family intramembrane glutamic endopeptidase [Mycolicibacter]OBH15893.1 abortive infection protein [Mycolicibacter sinensis]OBI31257.1 abortive infection protein [Mycolicibacter sinensis]RRR47325.1 CPBP family intramembrane metalloprotease [Mycolicibacter terrae]